MTEASIDADLDGLLDTVRPMAEAFSAAGFSLYLVGGIVRDQLLGRPLADVDDIDLTTDARPADIKRLLAPLADALWTQGERFGTIGARIGNVSYEVTTHRAERYDADSRKPEVAYADVIDADLARRDFTINAMARRLPSGDLVDPHGGRADLEAGVLRTPLDPEVSFGDDPLRMLRAARFMARMAVEPAADMDAAISAMVDRIDIVSVERVRDELLKLLGAVDPSPGVALLVRTGLVDHCLPALRSPKADRMADLIVDGLIVDGLIVNDAESAADHQLVPDPLARLALLWSDLSDAAVSSAGDSLRLSNDQTAAVRSMVAATRLALGERTKATAPDDELVRRVAHRAGPHWLAVRALVGVLDTDRAHAFEDRRRLVEGGGDDLSDWSVPLGGSEIMELLDIEPGPIVGRATAELLALRFREGPVTAERATDHLLDWARSS